jgi:hypothetical protein
MLFRQAGERLGLEGVGADGSDEISDLSVQVFAGIATRNALAVRLSGLSRLI